MWADHPYLYPYSATEAGRRNELTLWRESHRANIAYFDGHAESRSISDLQAAGISALVVDGQKLP